MEEEAAKTGKTVAADLGSSIADLLSSVLSDWSKFVKFLLLLVCICAMIFGLVYVTLNNLPKETQEIKFGSTGSILFSRSTKNGEEYVVVISPQGWQETAISVDQGDKIRVEASGKVQIDSAGLNYAIASRRDADHRILQEEIKAGRWEQEKNNFLPEDHYTPEDHEKIMLRWTWSTPKGLDTGGTLFPARPKESVMPSRGYGALLAAIRETGVLPDRQDAIFIGTSANLVAQKSGKLYFVVNDLLSKDKNFPDMFFVDNIGFYYAKVTVSK
jgi:hypothetical protein